MDSLNGLPRDKYFWGIVINYSVVQNVFERFFKILVKKKKKPFCLRSRVYHFAEVFDILMLILKFV